jgi:hypothetical protein
VYPSAPLPTAMISATPDPSTVHARITRIIRVLITGDLRL